MFSLAKVLCAWSDCFRVMLESDTWLESKKEELPITLEGTKVFPLNQIPLHCTFFQIGF